MRLILTLFLLLSSNTAFSIKQTTIKNYILKTEKQYKLPPALLDSVIEHESSYQIKAINPVSNYNSVTSYGLGQITLPTARDYCDIKNKNELVKHDKNIKCTAKILRHHLDEYGDVASALSAYRAGSPCNHQAKRHIRICTQQDSAYVKGILRKIQKKIYKIQKISRQKSIEVAKADQEELP